MRIKFVDSVPSNNTDYPFRPGQIIDVPRLTAEHRRWIADGLAVLVDDAEASADASVTADVDPASERAVLPRPKRRG